MQSGHFLDICHLGPNFSEDANLDHFFSVGQCVVGLSLSIRNHNDAYTKSPYICVACYIKQHMHYHI